MPVRSTSPPYGRRSLRPGPVATGHEKRPNNGGQQVKESERQNERKLFAQVLAQRVLAREGSGRNFEAEENHHCRRDSRNSSQLHPETEEVTNARAERSTKQNRKKK